MWKVHLNVICLCFVSIAKFKEICPGGMGYTVLPNPPVKKPGTVYQETIDLLPPQPLPTPERPVEAFGKPEEIIPGQFYILLLPVHAHLFLFDFVSVAQVKIYVLNVPRAGQQSITGPTQRQMRQTNMHSHSTVISESIINLTCMFLDCEWKLQYPERTHTCPGHQPRCELGMIFPWGDSANHQTNMWLHIFIF